MRGILGQTADEQGTQRLGNPAEVGLAVPDAVQQVGGGPAAERADAGGGEDQHPGQREHIARRRVFQARRLLGRHERRRSHGVADVRQMLVAEGPGDAEVDDPRALRRHQDVRRLQVAVHHLGAVQLLQTCGEGGAEHAHGRLRKRAARLDGRVQRGAEDVLGGQPRGRRLGVGVDDHRTVTGADDACRVRLQPEAGPQRGVRGETGVQRLHRDRAAARRMGQVDGAHTARTEAGEDPERPNGVRVVMQQWGDHGLSALAGRRTGVGRSWRSALWGGECGGKHLGRLTGQRLDDPAGQRHRLH